MSLDQFLPPYERKPEPERCSNPHCRKILGAKEAKYVLRIKGKEAPYCPACAKKILHPQENTEENL